MSSEEPAQTPAELMGIRSKEPIAAAPTSGALPFTKNKAPTTAWEIYNNRAAISDKEMIKDWNASLNTLLVFAALYSAVLTAFIIESMKLMQQDATGMTRDILLIITKQLANQSTPAFEPPPFEIPSYATRVNALFFISIMLSLIAAFGAVLGLQWVGNYDFGLNSSSAKERALQRHFRYMGIEEWRMAEIIAFLPIFLFISLFLFLIGLANWLFQIHKVISALVIMGVIIASVFYIATTIIAIRHVDAPFRTPVSKSLPVIYYATRKSVKSLTRFIFQKHQPPSEDEYSFKKREGNAIRGRPFLEMDSLLWAVKSIDILPHARGSFKVLLEAFMNLPTEQLFDRKINDAPWLPIFQFLCQPYFHRRHYRDYNEDELRSGEIIFILKAMAMIGDDGFNGEEFRKIKLFLSSLSTIGLWDSTGNPLQAYANLTLCRRGHGAQIRDILRYVQSSFHLPHVEMLRLLAMLRNLQLTKPELFHAWEIFSLHANIAPGIHIDLRKITSYSPLPYEILDLLLQLFTTELTGPDASISYNPLKAYLSAYEKGQLVQSIELGYSYHIAHRFIRRHYIAHLTQIHEDTDSSSSELAKVMTPIYDILLWTQGETRIATLRDILSAFLDSPFEAKLRGLMSNYTLIKVVSLAFCVPAPSGFNPLTFDHESKDDWFMEMSICCDARLNENGYGSDDQISFLRLYYKTLSEIDWRMISVKEHRWFKSIRSPYVALLVWVVTSFEFEHPALISFPPEIWSDPVWDELAQWSFSYQHFDLSLSFGFIAFARGALAYGSQGTKKNCIKRLVDFIKPGVVSSQPSQTNIYNLFQAPALQNMLSLPATVMSPGDQVKVLCWISIFPWFNHEFIEANGFTWLESVISSLRRYKWCIRMTMNAAPQSRSFSELAQWMNFLRECLARTSFEDYGYPLLQIDRLESILAEQSEQRSCDSTELSEPSRYHYIRTWAESEWNNWRMYMEELTKAVGEEYNFEQQPYFAIDPDGVCSSKLRQDFGGRNKESVEVGDGDISVSSGFWDD